MTTTQQVNFRMDVLSVLKDDPTPPNNGGLTVIEIAEALGGADWYETLAAVRALPEEGYDIFGFQGLGGACPFGGIEYTLTV